MTILTAIDRWSYAGAGTTGPFATTRKILDSSDVAVRILDTASGAVLSTLVLDVDYTVTDVGNPNGAAIRTTAAVAGGTTLLIVGQPALTQPSDFIGQADFKPKRHEDAYDRLANQVLWLQDQLNRAVMSPVEDSAVLGKLPRKSLRVGLYQAFDVNGDPVASIGTGNDTALRTDLANGSAGTDGSLLTGFRRSEAGSVAMSVHAVLAGWLFVTMFGAVGDDATDNATALSNALAATDATYGGDIFVPRGKYRINSQVSSSRSNLRIHGEKGSEISVNGNTGLSLTGDDIRIDGIRFTSRQTASANADTAVYVLNASRVEITRCRFGRVLLLCRSEQPSSETSVRVEDNDFDGDFSGTSGTNANLCYITGTEDVQIRNNRVSAINFYRWCKISTAVGDANDTHRCKRVHIKDNVLNVSCAAGQEIIDLFAATEDLDVSGNAFTVAGASVGYVISTKSGSAVDVETSRIDNYVIGPNRFRLGAGVQRSIYVEGAWGLPWESGIEKALIHDNIIETANTGTQEQISVKGLNVASVVDNVVNRASVANARAISSNSCQNTIIASNNIAFGNIEVLGGGSSSGGDAYTKSPQSILVRGNLIDDMNSVGAINCDTLTAAEEITISDNHLRSQADSGSQSGAIRFTSVTTTRLNVHDNVANLSNTAKNRVSVSSLTATNRIEHDNSWNQLTFTYDPSNLVDGAGETSAGVSVTDLALGDWVRVMAPYDLQGITVTGYVSAAGTARARVQNESGGAIDLASGTWHLNWGKG